MSVLRLICQSAIALGVGTAAWGQTSGPRSPIADSVERPLLPSGISRLPIELNGRLGYMFKDDDGTDAVHIIGDFVLTFGEKDGRRLRSHEAVVWLSRRHSSAGDYQHLQVFLWRDATVHGAAGTVTSAAALFVSLSTLGPVSVAIDDVAMQPSGDSRVYSEGNAIRASLSASRLAGRDENVAVRVFDVSGLRKDPASPKPSPLIHIRSSGELALTETDDGRRVLTVTGGVYIARGVPGSGEYLEIRADSVVIFLPSSEREDEAMPKGMSDEPDARERRGNAAREARAAPDRQLLSAGFGDVEVESAYLEGDVEMSQGLNTIRAARLHYDFQNDRALILDAVIRTNLVDRNLPLYLRASEIRQLARNRYAATDAVITTSEFHTPHYHIGASLVELSNLTPADPTGRTTGIGAGSFRIRHATLNVGGRPILYWPFMQGNVDTSETAIKGIRSGFSDDFGAEFETDWHLFNVLGLETPKGFTSTLSLDYFTQRGPAIGVDARYKRDRYFGTLRSYLLLDKDKDFLGREREQQSVRDVRGRLLLRHRQYVEEDWQVSLEVSYVSDKGFLEEFFEREFDNEKKQETLLHLKKQRDNWAFVSILQFRILDFVSEVERLPDLAFHLTGQPVGTGGTWHSENRLGYVRLRAGDQSFRELLRSGRAVETGAVARVDSRQEVGFATDVGPLRLVPFATLRGSAWDDSPSHGGVARLFGVYGVRGSLYLSRIYPDYQSTLFDIDGVRHIVKSDITAWTSHTNRNADELFPFDETIEGVDETDGIAIAVRQRWQTKRGAGKNRRKVDFLTIDAELGVFNGASGEEMTNGFVSFSRPENSISRNYLNSSLIWRVNDRTAFLSELNYDINDGEIDVLNVSVAVERSPRMTYLVGYRMIEESNSELLAFNMNYRLTEKHTLALREAFDLSRGQSLDFTIALIRKFPRWFGAISFAFDEPEDDFGISLSIWPEGLPGATLGSNRFSGITSIARLRGN